MNLPIFVSSLAILIALPMPAIADLIPPGFKSVEHNLVFVESEALHSHRLVAAPVRGFGGITEIQAGVPFRFSTKYRTRFYLIPKDTAALADFDPAQFASWPSVDLPQTEIQSVPIFSTVATALTTLKFTGIIQDGSPQIELVEHKLFDTFGNRAGIFNFALRALGLVTVGLLIMAVLYRKLRGKRMRDKWGRSSVKR